MFIAEKGPGFMVSHKLEKIGTHNAARAYDQGQRCDFEAGMAKYTASEERGTVLQPIRK
jgi:hypothetical protein